MGRPPAELPPPEPSPEDVRRAAEEILSRPEFRQPPKSLYDRAIDWLGGQLDRLLSVLFSGGRSAVVGWVLLLAVAAVIGVLVWRVARSVRRDPKARDDAEVRTAVRRTAAEWEHEAAEHERAGRWREALRCRHRALVARLADDGVVDEIDGRTAGEYRLEVRHALPSVARDFGDATDLFERVWYGGRAAGSDDDERFRALADRVLAGSGARQ